MAWAPGSWAHQLLVLKESPSKQLVTSPLQNWHRCKRLLHYKIKILEREKEICKHFIEHNSTYVIKLLYCLGFSTRSYRFYILNWNTHLTIVNTQLEVRLSTQSRKNQIEYYAIICWELSLAMVVTISEACFDFVFSSFDIVMTFFKNCLPRDNTYIMQVATNLCSTYIVHHCASYFLMVWWWQRKKRIQNTHTHRHDMDPLTIVVSSTVKVEFKPHTNNHQKGMLAEAKMPQNGCLF